MVRKRELTVELWSEDMKRHLEHARKIGSERFADMYYMSGRIDSIRGMVDVIYEMQMAEAWRYSGMQVYDFDPDFADSIIDERWMELLPDCIAMRPHDCFYMKLPCSTLSEGAVVNVVPTENILGFDLSFFPGAEDGKGVYIGGDPDSSDGGHSRAVINTGDELLCLCYFAISKTHELMLDDTPLEQYPVELVANGVAYICSANADIVPSYKPLHETRRNNAKRRSHATWSDVGYRIGAELRAYDRARRMQTAHQGGSIRPHMRRAHWHHFWTGPRDGERRLVLKWLAPTLVGVEKPGSPTMHRLR